MKSKTAPVRETNVTANDVTQSESNGKVNTSSVERVFGILEDLAISRSMTFTDVMDAAESRRDRIPKATLSNLMSTLTRLGYVRYLRDDRTYSLGIRLISLGEMAKAALQYAGHQKECRELLKAVVQKTQVGAHIAILDSGFAVYIMREEAPDFFGAKIWEGRQQVPHLTAVGKALMSGLRREQVKEILDQHSSPKNTRKDRDAKLKSFMQELAKIRIRGWAIDDEEHALGVRCVAAPIYSSTGEVVASIGVSRRTKDFDLAEMDRYGRKILRPAADQAAKTPRILNVLARHYSMSNNPKRGRL